MSPFKEDPRVRELLDRVAELDGENAALNIENDKYAADLDYERGQSEMYLRMLGNDQAMEREIETLHEFVADVRLGIRDLDEYEEVCRRAGLVA